jgi:hypothetical protein
MIYFLNIPISIQLLGPDLVFPVYEIDREHSASIKSSGFKLVLCAQISVFWCIFTHVAYG